MIDFVKQVLERSHSVPVVVDFWAEWCGPCRILGPIIERLADRATGRWELVKINTEEQPEIAIELGIQGIPAVKMFSQGRVIAEFVGALPEDEVRRWLDANLPDPRKDTLDQLAARWLREGHALLPDLEEFSRNNPDLPAARLRVAQAVVTKDPARARDLVGSIETTAETIDLSEDILALASLMEAADIPPKISGTLIKARDALAKHDLDSALEHLIDVVAVDRDYADDLARRCAVALFRLLGQGHDLTQKHQRRLSMALHA